MKKILLLCALTTQFTFAAANNEPWREFGISRADYEESQRRQAQHDDAKEAQRVQRQFDEEEATRLEIERIRQEEASQAEIQRIQDEEATRLEIERIRQEDEKRLQEEASQAEIQRIQDEEATQALIEQTEHEQYAAPSAPSFDFPQLSELDRSLYHPIVIAMKALSEYPDGLDVHAITVTFGQRFYQQIRALEKQYLGHTNGSLLTYEHFKETLQDHNPLMLGIIRNIDHYLATNPVDFETRQNLRTVFEEVYTMAVRMDEGNPLRPNYNLLLEKLNENIETGGGCHPGVTGRLIALYATMLINQLGHQGLDI